MLKSSMGGCASQLTLTGCLNDTNCYYDIASQTCSSKKMNDVQLAFFVIGIFIVLVACTAGSSGDCALALIAT